MSVPKIKKLDPVVVNRIAAGEVIQRPSNALKELIENCLDAKSTNIQITIKDGGLKLLQIQDNGTGIRKEDLEIVCERFTTSKLQEFDDLKSISTFGFRGEALASISHVAQLTITTKTADEKCAYKASYIDGKLKEPPVPCAGNQGTIISVENLFYNVPTRRKALSNAFDEFIKISEVVHKYAVHNPAVGFTLKKHGDVKTQVRTPHSSTKMNNIRILYGNTVFRELMEITLEDTKYNFKLHALITNPNYSNKKLTLLLFINHRLVMSTAIRKMIEELYSIYLPKKTHPFCYISLEIIPSNIDVNVHPTKHEVKFLHEDTIIEKVKHALDEKLSANDASRTFYIQNKLPTININSQALKEVLPEHDKDIVTKTKKLHQQQMVRTDATDQKLDRFNFTIEKASQDTEVKNCDKNNQSKSSIATIGMEINEAELHIETNLGSLENETVNKNQITEKDLIEQCDNNDVKMVEKEVDQLSKDAKNSANENKVEVSKKKNEDNENGTQNSNLIRKLDDYCVNNFRREVKLLSVLELRKKVEENYDEGLRNMLANLIFVGCVDKSHALVQSDVNLYICNTQKLAEELFYEIMLYNFANHGIIKFSEPLPIYELAMMGLETEEASWEESDGKKEDLSENVKELLLEKADMLREYFSIIIDKNGNLKSLPILIENYFPSMSELPLFILRLATEVDWTSEKPCFKSICRETARFYSRIDSEAEIGTWMHKTEHILYIAFKESLLPPKRFVHDSTILQIATLPDLYKVFERC